MLSASRDCIRSGRQLCTKRGDKGSSLLARLGSASALVLGLVRTVAIGGSCAIPLLVCQSTDPQKNDSTYRKEQVKPPVSVDGSGASETIPVRLARVIVRSEPDNASIEEKGVGMCFATPCSLPYSGTEADPSSEHRIVLRRNGCTVERLFRVSEGIVNVTFPDIPRCRAPVTKPIGFIH